MFRCFCYIFYLILKYAFLQSWLGSRKIKNSIPIEDIIGVLYRHSAPPEMLEKYLELIEDTERRLALAKELLMVKFAADVRHLRRLKGSFY